jgi:HD-GYP domain-containing protein (c-di-GMP phosphodiesterase class II)
MPIRPTPEGAILPMNVDISTKNTPRRYSLLDQAKAVAVILRKEFDAPFRFFDALTGAHVYGDPEQPIDPTLAPHLDLEPHEVLALAAGGPVSVRPLPNDSYQLALLHYEGKHARLVAVGALAALARKGQAAQEQARLAGWLRAVSERLRLMCRALNPDDSQQAFQMPAAYQALLVLDQLIHKIRIHKDPAESRQQILEAAAKVLRVQTLIWVPAGPGERVLQHGEVCLASSDCYPLAQLLERTPELQASGVLLCNQVQASSWGARLPSIGTLLAFRVPSRKPIGWVIFLNKKGDPDDTPMPGTARPFRHSDAALLAPFASLLELSTRSTGRYQELKNLLVGLTRALTSAIDAKDSYTFGHSERVARIAVELGRELKLNDMDLSDIYLAGLLHDIGKIGIRDSVLSKPGKLTPEEFEHIKQHVTIGHSILADLQPIRNLLPGVLYHHERYDGTGYPEGLKGDLIPQLARILAVADSYDAMSTSRPYRQALSPQRVEEILVQGAGTQWDQRVVEAFLRCRHRIHLVRQQGVGESLRSALDGAMRKDDSSLRVRDSLKKWTG